MRPASIEDRPLLGMLPLRAEGLAHFMAGTLEGLMSVTFYAVHLLGLVPFKADTIQSGHYYGLAPTINVLQCKLFS